MSVILIAMETIPSFDVYFLDGSILRFVCNIEAEGQDAAEKLVQRRVRPELRWNMVVKPHGWRRSH